MPVELITVHRFIAQVRMHPELLQEGMTEFDLERFRKMRNPKNNQAALDDWMKRFICESVHG